jgi:hypothetical protein
MTDNKLTKCNIDDGRGRFPELGAGGLGKFLWQVQAVLIP